MKTTAAGAHETCQRCAIADARARKAEAQRDWLARTLKVFLGQAKQARDVLATVERETAAREP